MVVVARTGGGQPQQSRKAKTKTEREKDDEGELEGGLPAATATTSPPSDAASVAGNLLLLRRPSPSSPSLFLLHPRFSPLLKLLFFLAQPPRPSCDHQANRTAPPAPSPWPCPFGLLVPPSSSTQAQHSLVSVCLRQPPPPHAPPGLTTSASRRLAAAVICPPTNPSLFSFWRRILSRRLLKVLKWPISLFTQVSKDQ
ncbi:uncharacterized protein [Spinacia oleracea]|uniref:Uncharacterized protein n=1 Tax=Spinacia oleracea TaxID=3562 RepID=A0ABM3RHN8_SPIOL|nr:uncharacterized protein LOC130469718 [Spinacia oleracea]